MRRMDVSFINDMEALVPMYSLLGSGGFLSAAVCYKYRCDEASARN